MPQSTQMVIIYYISLFQYVCFRIYMATPATYESFQNLRYTLPIRSIELDEHSTAFHSSISWQPYNQSIIVSISRS
jgi:hypothetical protein